MRPRALNAEPAERYTVSSKLPPEQFQGLQILKRELAERNAARRVIRASRFSASAAPGRTPPWCSQIEDIIGYNPLRLADYERAIGPGENAEDPNLRRFPATLPGLQVPARRACSASNTSFSTALIEQLPRHFPRLTGAEVVYGTGQDVGLSPQHLEPRARIWRIT